MRSLNFQGRKDTQAIFSYCLRFRADDHPPLIQYIYHKPETLVQLCFGYESADSAIQCGSIVREALKFRIIAEMMYSGRSGGGPAADEELSKLLTNFFTWIDRGNFQVSADAFTTFRVGVYDGPFLSVRLWADTMRHRFSGDPHSAQRSRFDVSR